MPQLPDAQVAVITATTLGAQRPRYLAELHESLEAQQVDFEWILVPNGPSADLERVPKTIMNDPRVTICPRPHAGAAYARNIALNYVRAPFVCYADDDDILPPGSLAVRYNRAARSGLQWVAGLSADLAADGTVRTWKCPTPVGPHRAGDVWTYWRSPRASKPPMGHTMLLTRTDLVRMSAGHGGLFKGEDYVLYPGTSRVPRRSCRLTGRC